MSANERAKRRFPIDRRLRCLAAGSILGEFDYRGDFHADGRDAPGLELRPQGADAAVFVQRDDIDVKRIHMVWTPEEGLIHMPWPGSRPLRPMRPRKRVANESATAIFDRSRQPSWNFESYRLHGLVWGRVTGYAVLTCDGPPGNQERPRTGRDKLHERSEKNPYSFLPPFPYRGAGARAACRISCCVLRRAKMCDGQRATGSSPVPDINRSIDRGGGHRDSKPKEHRGRHAEHYKEPVDASRFLRRHLCRPWGTYRRGGVGQ